MALTRDEIALAVLQSLIANPDSHKTFNKVAQRFSDNEPQATGELDTFDLSALAACALAFKYADAFLKTSEDHEKKSDERALEKVKSIAKE